jgi:hypothetical protein
MSFPLMVTPLLVRLLHDLGFTTPPFGLRILV